MNCPYCDAQLLRHIGQKGLYWYCLDCRQVIAGLKELKLITDASEPQE